MTETMTSMERTVTALSHKEPDQVPLFLLFSMYGARELGVPVRTYFSRPEYVVEGQTRLRRRFQGDCLYAFTYAAAEVEAWGGEAIFRNDGPPNAGPPVIPVPSAIETIGVPEIEESPTLLFTTRTIELLKREVGGDVPIIGCVMSPFSLPVMQMGFSAYLDLMYGEPDLFRVLMKKNSEFCVAWANAQLAAGATAIGYFDPLASPDLIPRDLYQKTGLPVALDTIPRIHGGVVAHLGSARTQPVLDDLAGTGCIGVGVSAQDDLHAVKQVCKGKMTVIGNLNGIAMRHWTPEEADTAVKSAIAAAGPGGGFILSDNHGEIPWQVPESVLLAVSRAARKWGKYPLKIPEQG